MRVVWQLVCRTVTCRNWEGSGSNSGGQSRLVSDRSNRLITLVTCRTGKLLEILSGDDELNKSGAEEKRSGVELRGSKEQTGVATGAVASPIVSGQMMGKVPLFLLVTAHRGQLCDASSLLWAGAFCPPPTFFVPRSNQNTRFGGMKGMKAAVAASIRSGPTSPSPRGL